MKIMNYLLKRKILNYKKMALKIVYKIRTNLRFHKYKMKIIKTLRKCNN